MARLKLFRRLLATPLYSVPIHLNKFTKRSAVLIHNWQPGFLKGAYRKNLEFK